MTHHARSGTFLIWRLEKWDGHELSARQEATAELRRNCGTQGSTRADA